MESGFQRVFDGTLCLGIRAASDAAPQNQSEVATTYNQIGDLLWGANKFKDALENYRRSLILLEGLSAARQMQNYVVVMASVWQMWETFWHKTVMRKGRLATMKERWQSWNHLSPTIQTTLTCAAI